MKHFLVDLVSDPGCFLILFSRGTREAEQLLESLEPESKNVATKQTQQTQNQQQ